MTRPGKALICLTEIICYHLTSRCVRRACLCGVDHYNSKSQERPERAPRPETHSGNRIFAHPGKSVLMPTRTIRVLLVKVRTDSRWRHPGSGYRAIDILPGKRESGAQGGIELVRARHRYEVPHPPAYSRAIHRLPKRCGPAGLESP